jgi:multicomponent K+:H+ antiporter subunit F
VIPILLLARSVAAEVVRSTIAVARIVLRLHRARSGLVNIALELSDPHGLAVLAMAFATIRVLRGPTAQDRVPALDTLYVNGMLALLLLGLSTRSTAYFDMALLIALFGFVGTMALANFLLRGEVVEP